MVAPENPEDSAGARRVYDKVDSATRLDVTAAALAAVAAGLPDEKPGSGPTRGCVVRPEHEGVRATLQAYRAVPAEERAARRLEVKEVAVRLGGLEKSG
ncbi:MULTISPECIES: hypothetical protein [Streptomyces]|uniref:hypothetical protein n=1 Tax=Streptomyces TaxID=1883 RepID=UPI0022495FBA|nr:hypothetical protein [Streptomyces sp. JHD 1]MCX2971615.1 hypothetical protein [Streptomyces sp. JHD 1]